MRQVQKGKGRKPRKKAEPLAEGIIPLDSRGKRKWSAMSYDEIVEYAQRLVKGKITSRYGLQKADKGLYQALLRRKLLDRVIPQSAHGERRPRYFFTRMSDDEFVGYAKGIVREKALKGRTELLKADYGLYQALKEKKLLEKVIPESVNFNAGRRRWASMSDDVLVDYACGFVGERGLKKRSVLKNADRGLYDVLRKRKLLDAVFLPIESELGGNAEGIRITGRGRNWAPVGDEEIVEYACKVVEEKGLNSRNDLQKTDSGLYYVLRKRKLLDHVFAPLESEQKREAVQQVVDAMKEFDHQ